MKIGLFHGYELSGSGSNEFTRYLARTLVQQGHEVHILCREPKPQQFDFIDQAWIWDTRGLVEQVTFTSAKQCIFHSVPLGAVHPVYLQDKQRTVQVKAFVKLSDAELEEFRQVNERALEHILQTVELDILMANHLVMQPSVALKACELTHTPLVIFPHGSAIEYVVKKDQRYWQEARLALQNCQAVVTGNAEVRDRILGLFPDITEEIQQKAHIVGVGVDTTLFRPSARSKRRQNIEEFVHAGFPKSGKPVAQVQALVQDLRSADLHRLTQHPKPYGEGLDEDVEEKLKGCRLQDPVIVFVGALTVGKGLQSLICAMALLLEKLPAQLLIIGAGAYRETLEALIYSLQQGDESLLHRLCDTGFDLDRNDEVGPWPDVAALLAQDNLSHRLLAQGPRLAQSVHFLGRMNHEQLSYVFPCADLAVFPSVIPEAYPLVLMESLANGVLPMVSYFSGFRDGINELYDFLDQDLVDLLKIPMDHQRRIVSMAQQMEKLIGRLGQDDYSAQLASIAQENYDWHHRARQLVETFTRILDD